MGLSPQIIGYKELIHKSDYVCMLWAVVGHEVAGSLLA